MTPLRAPFPWFGGKRRVAEIVWAAFGSDIANYVEPFAGSLAVLLARPGGAGKIETVNDRDCYLSNFWRAVTANPEAVAEWADWPVNEADLHARHAWIVSELPTHRARMHSDADYYDEKIAGWWVWGLCQWIGGGWCTEPNNQKHPKARRDRQGRPRGRRSQSCGAVATAADDARRFNRAGVHARALPQKMPALAVKSDGAHAGRGIHSDAAVRAQSQQIPNLRVDSGASGSGVHASGFLKMTLGRRPQMTSAGQGVHLPSLGNDRGLNGIAAAPCLEWFVALQDRLRRVRVACGDWQRVLGPSVLGKGKNVGGRRPCAVLLDPPYSHEFRDAGLYAEDDAAISSLVRDWALAHGDDPDLRIALCGYESEHEMPKSWRMHSWKAARGYAGEENDNREQERIWFSPHCLRVGVQGELFAAGATCS